MEEKKSGEMKFCGRTNIFFQNCLFKTTWVVRKSLETNISVHSYELKFFSIRLINSHYFLFFLSTF